MYTRNHGGCCLSIAGSRLAYTQIAFGHSPEQHEKRNVAIHSGLGLSSSIKSSQSPKDMAAGQSDLGNTSNETPLWSSSAFMLCFVFVKLTVKVNQDHHDHLLWVRMYTPGQVTFPCAVTIGGTFEVAIHPSSILSCQRSTDKRTNL